MRQVLWIVKICRYFKTLLQGDMLESESKKKKKRPTSHIKVVCEIMLHEQQRFGDSNVVFFAIVITDTYTHTHRLIIFATSEVQRTRHSSTANEQCNGKRWKSLFIQKLKSCISLNKICTLLWRSIRIHCVQLEREIVLHNEPKKKMQRGTQSIL